MTVIATASCATMLAACSYAGAETAEAATPPAPGQSTTTSADFLAQLPDGEEKRRFLLDSTNCHTFDETSMREGDALRTRASWIATAQRMIGYAGANTAFPIMSVGRDAEQTTDWIIRYAVNTPAAGVDRVLPPGARVDEFLLPVAEDLPHDVAVLDDGRVLVTGHVHPSDLGARSHAQPVGHRGHSRRQREPARDRSLGVVRVDRTRGRIWIGTGTADAVFMFDPRTERFQMYPLPSRGALVRHIDIHDATGEVWLAYGAAPGIPARIARLTPAE